MNQRMGLIVLILGVAIIAFTFVDPTNMAASADGGWGIMSGHMGDWPPLRIGVMVAGALLGILGAYSVSKKQPEKKQ